MSGLGSRRSVRFLERFETGEVGCYRRSEWLGLSRRLVGMAVAGLSCLEAAEVLGMSERHFRRLRDRYEAEGAEGLIDRRRGRASGRRAPVDQIEWLLEQYRTRYWDFTTKHFHEHLVCDHGFAYGYTWTKLQLQRAGLVKPAKRPRGAPPAAAQAAASRHAGVPGRLALPLACGVGPRAGPGGEHGRCHERGLFGLSGGGGKHALELPGAPGDDQRRRVCSAASTPTGGAITS